MTDTENLDKAADGGLRTTDLFGLGGALHCQNGQSDLCLAARADGVVCPHDSCDITDGIVDIPRCECLRPSITFFSRNFCNACGKSLPNH